MNRIKLTFFTLLISGITIESFGQLSSDSTKEYKNRISLEAFGTGGYYSVKYNRFLLGKKKIKFNSVSGIGYWWVNFNNAHSMIIYTGLNFAYSNHSKFEPSFSLKIAGWADPFANQHHCPGQSECSTEVYFFSSADFGLQYHITTRLSTRASFDLFYLGEQFWPWGSFSVGYEF